MKIFKVALVVFSVFAFTSMLAKSAGADPWGKETKITFSQPVEIPGRVLPAGTYTFQVLRGPMLRNVVQIYNEDGTKLVATLLTIRDETLKASNATVLEYQLQPRNAPAALRAWFYPGDKAGHEFVYPESQVHQIEAAATAGHVPTLGVDVGE